MVELAIQANEPRKPHHASHSPGRNARQRQSVTYLNSNSSFHYVLILRVIVRFYTQHILPALDYLLLFLFTLFSLILSKMNL